jgi:hypothetical protein
MRFNSALGKSAIKNITLIAEPPPLVATLQEIIVSLLSKSRDFVSLIGSDPQNLPKIPPYWLDSSTPVS